MSENAMTTAEAAEYLGLSKGYMGILRHKGTGPTGTKEKGRVAYARSDLDAWKAGRSTAPAAAKGSRKPKAEATAGSARRAGKGPRGEGKKRAR